MKTAWMLGLVLTLAWPLTSQAQQQKWTEDDWQPLIDEPSRGDLLRMNSPIDYDILALPRQFQFPEDTQISGGPRFYGIDISHYQPLEIDFTSFKSKNIRYVYMKATQGTTHKDGKFSHFWNSIGALPNSKKISRGPYHFLSALRTSDPELQAERFVAYVNLHGGLKDDDLPPVMDLEWDYGGGTVDRWSALTPSQIVTKALKFLQRVEALTGRIPMIYTTKAWWRERGIPDSEFTKFARYKLWIPDYSNATLQNESPRGPNNTIPDLWQFTDRSRILGEGTAQFDANAFFGTEDEFLSLFLD